MEIEIPKTTIPPIAVATPPIPVAISTPQKVYSENVQYLVEMGFQDPDFIERVLEKNQNDMSKTVQDLLNFNKNN